MVDSPSICYCGASKSVYDHIFYSFSAVYNGIKSCFFIMLETKLTSMNTAYSMILPVKKLCEIHSLGDTSDTSAMLVIFEILKKGGTRRGNTENKYNSKNKDRHCDHCNNDGHIQDTCFKLHDYLDWYKELKKKNLTQPSRLLLTLQTLPLQLSIILSILKILMHRIG